MEIKIKVAKHSLEKLASLYADNIGMSAEELVAKARARAKKDAIPEEDALYLITREAGRMSATIIPLSALVPQSRAGESEGIALSMLAAVIDDKGNVDVRTVKGYPDTEDDMALYDRAKPGVVVKPEVVWKMTGKDSGGEIKDETGKGIIGIKKLHVVEADSDFKTDEISKEISKQYREMFAIKGEAERTYMAGLEAGKKKKGATLFSSVVRQISEFEEASFLILSELRLPRKVEKKEGYARKPHLDAIALYQRRGVSRHNEIAIYGDSDEDILDIKSKYQSPILARSNNVFELRTVGEDNSQQPMIDALGNVKVGVRGLIVDKHGDEVRKEYAEHYKNVLDVCDPSQKGVFVPPQKREAGQKVEFYDLFNLPFVLINGKESRVEESGTPVLRSVITDGKRTILGNAYGELAMKIVGATDVESFKAAVEEKHGGVLKNVNVFGARTHRVEDKSQKDLFFLTINSVHGGTEEPSDKEIEKIFSAVVEE